MANHRFKDKLFSVSPYAEVFFRHIYWKNIEKFSRVFKTHKRNTQIPCEKVRKVQFDNVLRHLSENGLEEASIAIVHSSYQALKATDLSPAEINQGLLELVGANGTLAMPAMPIFRNKSKVENYLTDNVNDQVYVYDVKSKRIKTGAMPTALAKHPKAIRSRHPINTMVAVGGQSEYLMKDNLKGESPLACGVYSPWNKCAEENAWVIGLGTDLTHSLTMIHVAEDLLDDKWPIPNWYREKSFIIKDGKFEKQVVLRERAPKWGALHFAERTLCKDLIKSGVLKSQKIDGVLLEMLRSKDLLDFLGSKNKNGYPYFGARI